MNRAGKTNTSRLASVPILHLVAELAAYPLASITSLELATTHLEPAIASRSAKQLWRGAEAALLGAAPSLTVDEAVSMRDRVWFREQTRNKLGLHDYLQRIARWSLEPHGTVAIPALPTEDNAASDPTSASEAKARAVWKWLSFALPRDLMLAALGTDGEPPRSVDMLSPQLGRILRSKGFAETHLHIGAAMEFETLWIAGMRAIASHNVKYDSFRSPGAEFSEGRMLGPWLIRCAVVRYLLGAYLAWGQQRGSFARFVARDVQQLTEPKIGPTGFAQLLQGIREVASGKLKPRTNQQQDFAKWQALYRAIVRLNDRHIPLESSDLPLADPMTRLFGQTVTPELSFLTNGLKHVRTASHSHTAGYPLFCRLFWQAVRIRNLFYRHVVQRPMTPGLTWFVRFFGRLSPAKKALSVQHLLEAAAKSSGVDRGLRSLEVRTSPGAVATELLRYVQEVDSAAEQLVNRRMASRHDSSPASPVEIGMVLHFCKDRGGGHGAGVPDAHWQTSHANPAASPFAHKPSKVTAFRYGDFYRAKRAEAISFGWLLGRYPLSLELVRGFDVCTDELGVPNWVLAPLLNYVRRSAHAGIKFVRRRIGIQLSRPRTTIHAGEDFVHLLTGLRFIDEAIHAYRLREGDRIGHGIALGVAPHEWVARAPRVAMPREQRLLDLVWAWSLCPQLTGKPDEFRHAALEHEIATHSEAIFGKRVPPFDLQLLVNDLYDETTLKAFGFPDHPPRFQQPQSERAERLRDFLMDGALFKRGREVIVLDPAPDAELLDYLQRFMRRKVGVSGLTVEINPTSNLLVGDLGDLQAHPMWRLYSPVATDDDIPPVPVCIGSDDPITFASRLPEEYQYLIDTMTLSNLSDEEAHKWLDRARDRGLQCRFTRPRPLHGKKITACYNSAQVVAIAPP